MVDLQSMEFHLFGQFINIICSYGYYYHKVDNRYTTAIGMSSWRFFNIGKYKNQKVKDVCYFNPFYVAWCLENWQGFSLTSYERQLEKDPEDQELILKVRKCKTIV